MPPPPALGPSLRCCISTRPARVQPNRGPLEPHEMTFLSHPCVPGHRHGGGHRQREGLRLPREAERRKPLFGERWMSLLSSSGGASCRFSSSW